MRLVLDLFDRRWEIVAELRSAIGEMMQEGITMGKPYWKFVSASQRAEFLFGREVTDYLEILRQAMVVHHAQKGGARSDDDAVRSRAADVEAATFTEITDFQKTFDHLVAPYMAMHQKLPN
jgi:hypothetical protein